MSPSQAAKLAIALGPDHPLVQLANEFTLKYAGKYPPWCCQKCGKPGSFLYRLTCGILHKHYENPSTI